MRIVIAEDSAVMRAGLVEILADSGHEVVAAVGTAGDLLAAVDEHHPDAAVGGGDQLQDPLQVGLPGPIDHAA